ncbi:hypothetical protein Dxin01_00741 [Deinococcus xinjiangensis]|uniref:Sel1 repeat family protein n=1 Tax=Deinococcus xinjiangensis TaxID=457454 RepID=A0ABP9V904_9DEIO
MFKRNLLISLLMLSTPVLAQSAQSADQLFTAGRWQAAADQAVLEGNYNLASLAMMRLMQCPSADQPKGQNWTSDVASKSLAYARSALSKTNLSNAERAEALTNAANAQGLLSIAKGGNVTEVLREARTVKSMYETAVQLAPKDALIVGTFAVWHAKAANRGGIVLGATRNSTRAYVTQAMNNFNASPDASADQRTRKALAAVQIGTALEGLNDKNLLKFFEAAIVLGDNGDASSRCAANLARVHLGRDISTY